MSKDYHNTLYPCPLCEGETFLLDSRVNGIGHRKRRRKCENCAHKYNTYEIGVGDYELLKKAKKIKNIMEL